MARSLTFKWRDTIGRKPVEPVPPGVHYDLWLGPAPEHPFTQNRFHYNWHWFWDYGNGDLGNQGIHQVDAVRWALGVKYPSRVSAIGGHFMFDDDQETPNTLNATYEFNDGGKKKMMVAEVRHWIEGRGGVELRGIRRLRRRNRLRRCGGGERERCGRAQQPRGPPHGTPPAHP